MGPHRKGSRCTSEESGRPAAAARDALQSLCCMSRCSRSQRTLHATHEATQVQAPAGAGSHRCRLPPTHPPTRAMHADEDIGVLQQLHHLQQRLLQPAAGIPVRRSVARGWGLA